MATEDTQGSQDPELKNSSLYQANPNASESHQLISTEQNAKLMDEWWFRRRDPYCA